MLIDKYKILRLNIYRNIAPFYDMFVYIICKILSIKNITKLTITNTDNILIFNWIFYFNDFLSDFLKYF